MREIKFRAWCEDEGMIDDIYIGTDDYTDMLNRSISYVKEFNNIILMQYTGLKDMDGREVYENDLVRDGEGRIFQMKHGSHTKVIMIELLKRLRISSYGWYLEKVGGGDIVTATECQYVEKAGNIYENPELLEEKADE